MRQEERVTVSRRKILETAIEEFGKRGYKEASTNDICEVCGISKGLVFYYFKSKKNLFWECVVYCMEQFDSYMKNSFVKGNSPMEGIRSCCHLRKDFFLHNPFYHQLFCEVIYRKTVGSDEIYHIFIDRYKRHNHEIISKVLEDVKLNSNIEREEGIKLAITMLEAVDMEIYSKYQGTRQTEAMLEEQMRQYEVFLEILLHGLLYEERNPCRE